MAARPASLLSAPWYTRAPNKARGAARLHVVGRPGGPVVGDVRAPLKCSHPGSAPRLVSPSARAAVLGCRPRALPPTARSVVRAGDTWLPVVPHEVRVALVVLPPFVAVLWLAYAALAAGGAP